jgi:pimeloyl-ACP methyl ester carboxylesterase
MLARDMRVISLDVRRHGRSGKPHDADGYGLQLVNDVTRLLDHLGLARAHVAGYSLGGFIALKLATVCPERLLSVAVLGAGWEPPENLAFLAALPKLADDLEAGRGIGPLMGNLGDERNKPGPVHRLWVKLLTRYFNDPKALVPLIRSTPDLAVSEAELRDLDLAVCSIVGSRDPLTASVDAMRGKVSDHTVCVVDGADHLATPMRAEFHHALRTFLLARPAWRPRPSASTLL